MIAEEIIQKFKENGYETIIKEKEAGVKKKAKKVSIWVNVDREKIREAIELMINFSADFPHFSIISASDLGKDIELNYHFTVDYGKELEEKIVSLKVILPKDDLRIKSITTLIPSAIFSEREIKEMVGVEIEEIPDERHMFLTEDFPPGIYPWRRDETSPKETNKLYENWR
ncbi:MAG: NADH-quinone oxidoreductase subunit C [Thermoplasmatales archaeon]|nr:NADH-quinone oxidoreductase subunit C [Thermoplasmatales archaeon]